MGIRVKD